MTDTIDYSSELETAINAVRRAALLCESVGSKLSPDVLEKNDRSPVTIADFGAQALVSQTLEQAFPDDPIIGEEDAGELRDDSQQAFVESILGEFNAVAGSTESGELLRLIDRCGEQEYRERFWTLDPIDGTKGFLRREQYAISLALVVEGQIVVAVVGCPQLGENAEVPIKENTGLLFTAVRGQGASVRSLAEGSTPEPIKVSPETDCVKMRFCESVESGHSSHGHSAQVAEILKLAGKPVRLDSQAKYCVVARGDAEIYLRLPTRPGYQEKIWDHAGGVLVVEEAGGTVTDVSGKPLEFTHGAKLTHNRGVVVTNGPKHSEVIAALAEVGVS